MGAAARLAEGPSKQFKEARFALDHVIDFFPSNAGRCLVRVEYNLKYYSH